MASFIHELLLVANSLQESTLEKRFYAAVCLYNGVLSEALKRLCVAKRSSFWKEASSLKRSKERSSLFRKALREVKFSEYSLHTYVKTLVHNCWIGHHIDSQVAQKIASRAFNAVDLYAKRKRGRPRFKKARQFSSLEGKSNITGIRFKDGCIYWKGLILQVIYDWKDKDGVQAHALGHRTKYVRLVRRTIRGKRYYFAQLVQEGKAYIKKRHQSPDEKVGLDLGPSSIAFFSKERAFLGCLSKNRENHKEVRCLQRALDRSLRMNNPENYTKKGSPLKGKRWVLSKRYQQKQQRFQERKRIMASRRKMEHGALANQILSKGKYIRTEKLSYKSWQTMYGKSVGQNAPGLLLEILRRKAENAGGEVIEFSPYPTKLSQTCHNCEKVEKKPLSQRWHRCGCGIGSVQRDLYSAYLAYHVEEGKLNRFQAQEAWESAGPLLKQALLRCKETAMGEFRLSSFGLSQSRSGLSVKDGSAANEVKEKLLATL